ERGENDLFWHQFSGQSRLKEGLVCPGRCQPSALKKSRFFVLPSEPLYTGYLDLDRRLEGGLRPDELWILAGQTGGCKTALATGIAYNAAMGGKRVAMFSLEMSVAQMEDRLLSIASGVPLAKLRRPARLNTADWEAIDRTDALLAACDIVIDDTPALSPFALHARCSRLRRERGLDLIVVDYLQIMGSNGRAATRELEVSAISKGLKSLAKEISVPVLALSQLNRNASSREDQRPILDDLRESGAIAQDADGVLFVHRTDDPRNENGAAVVPVEVIIAKQRNGAQGTVRLLLERQTAALYNSSPEEFSSTSSPAPRPAFPPREVCPF
nr:DnaB-like helicase C-terminal domain-containing protein [Desulfovibrio sp.]